MAFTPMRGSIYGTFCSSVMFLTGCASGPRVLPPPSAEASAYLPIAPGAPAAMVNPLPPDSVPIYNISQVEVQPMAISQARPHYPADLRVAGASGTATTDFVVDETGVPRSVTCFSATDPRFAAAAVHAVARWRFRPGLVGGRPVRVHMLVPIVFSLNNED